MKKRKGFTLVELAVVIAIIAILALVAIPKYTGVVEEARSAQAKAQLGVVRSALSIYYAKNHGMFPTKLVFSDGSLFAEGVVPEVESTIANGTVVKSRAVNAANTLNGVVGPEDVTDVGGWVYDVTSDLTKADVRINSLGTDPTATPLTQWFK